MGGNDVRHAWEHGGAVKTTCLRCGMRREIMPSKTRTGAHRKSIFSANGIEWGAAGPCKEAGQ